MLKKRMFSLLALTALIMSAGAAEAGPAYRYAAISDPAVDSWRGGFTIFFQVDQKICKENYGEAWPQECASAAMGETGTLAEGVSMSPETPGKWIWSSPNTLRFAPEERLAPQTRYTVKLDNVPLPKRVKMRSKTVVYETQGQAASVGHENFWIDPSPKGQHALSVPVNFIWPVDPAAMEKRFEFGAEKQGSGLELGKLRFVWNQARDSVVVNAPVAKMPRDNTRVRFAISGMPAYFMDKGRRSIVTAKNQIAGKIFTMTGNAQLMDVTRMDLLKDHDSDLNVRYVLEAKTSLRVQPSELLKSLDLVELPLHSEKGAGTAADWKKMPALSAADIQGGKKLQAQLISHDSPTDTVRFAVPLSAGRYLMAAVKEDLKSTGGLKLQSVRRFILRAPEMGSELAFLQPGNILTLGGEKKIDLYAMGLDSITWKARRIRDPFLAMLGGNRGFSDDSESYDPEDMQSEWVQDELASQGARMAAMSDSVSGTIALPKAGPGKGIFPVLDAAPLLQGNGDSRGLMNIEITGWAGGKKAAFASRLLLITDIGLTLKSEGDGSTVAFVQDLSSGKPMQGVEVSLLGVNGLPLISGKSDAAGMVRLASVTGLSAEQKPVAVIASSGRDLAWLSLQESSRKLDMSAFDVNGRHCEADGLLASVFSQRGLYMPGETLHFGALVRRFDWEPLPKGLPLEATLTSPTGATVLRKQLKVEPDGLVELAWQSPLDAPAGTYRLDITLPSAQAVLGSATARVEEFEPDTMAMKASLSPALPKGWIRTGQGAGKVEARVLLSTLYGNSAAGHRIQASFEASPARLGFSSKPDYTFYDATPPLSEERSIPIDEMFTGKDGSASFALPYESIGGSFRGTVRIDGFEAAGGRAVTRQIDAMFSPLEAVVGYKPTGEANNLDYIAKGAKAGLHVIALDNDLAPAALDGVTATFSSRRYVNSLVTDTRGEYRYDSTPVDEAIASKPAPIGKDGASIDLPSDTPGDYLLTLTGSKGETLAVIPFSVAGDKLKDPQLSGSSQSLAGGSLRLKLENASCEPGGTLTFTLSAPYAGSGLITIEREKVVASKWFTAKAGETTQQITVPEGFEGRGYVCVSFSRSADSDAIYMKPHAYAAAPFNCGLARRDMGLAIDAPQTILPGANMHVSLSAKRPGRALLFAVDEGVLSLTGFRTPAPLNDLLADRALDVVTRQAFDLLMPDHARLRGRIPAFGGDMGNPGGRFLNPFRRRSEPPFALWQGAVDLSSGKAELDIPVPSYLSGKIRIMAVGSSLDNGMLTAGSAESMTTVRGTIILRPLLPLAAAPEDTFEGALTVANTIKGSGKSLPVRIKIAPDTGLALVNTQLEQVVNVDEDGEAVIPFHARVSDKLGSSGITFTAESDKLPGGAAVVREQTLSIRPPVPRLRREEVQPVKNSVNIRSIRDMYPFEQKSTLSVASAEHLAMRSLAARLGTYPYGCTEQLISRAFPYAASLNDAAMLELFQSGKGMDPAKMRRERERALLTAVEAIERCFNGYQVSLWAGSEGDPFVTAYAADFLLTLRENGRAIPENLLRTILNTLESQSGNDPYNAADARIKAYACWLLLRDGRVVTQHVDNLEKWLDENAEGWKGDVTAALLADSNAMLRRSSRARKLMPSPLQASGEGYAGSMLTKGAAVGLYHAVIARPFWQDAQRADMDELRDAALNPHATTTEMALTGRALASLASSAPAADAVALSCTEPSGIGKAQALGSILELDAPGCRKFHLEVKDASRIENLSWILATDGFDHDVPDTISNGMEIRRRYLDSKGQEAASARIGEVLTVELTVSAGTPVKNVVLVDLLPGGLEPVLERDGDAPSADGLVRFERREDRGIFFINLEGDAAQTYTYRVRAVTAGKFIIPAATAEAMYAPDRNATTGGGYMDIAQ